MKLLLLLPLGSNHRGGDPTAIVDLAVRAEAAGLDGVVLAEHIVMGTDVSEYGWGAFPLDPSDPFPEPIVLASAIAVATSTIHISTGILIAALRPAALLAKQVATLDQLCGGRLSLGVGTGWHRAELEAHGLDFTRRGALLTDTIATCRRLWGPQPAEVDTSSWSYGPVYCNPTPVVAGGPPVLFSGTLTARNVGRIVTLGDGWIPIMREGTSSIGAGIRQLREAFEGAGRDPGTLRVRVPPAPATRRGALSLAATLEGDTLGMPGVTEVTLPAAAFVRSEADVEPFFEALAGFVASRAA